MAALTATAKGYKGIGMKGSLARWYASLTSKSMDRFVTLARRIADETATGAEVLEVAPGPGFFAIELAKLGHYRITGLDISETFVEIAQGNAACAGVEVDFRQGNASSMPFEDGRFNLILCTAAFKNFTQPVEALREMYRVLKPGGRAIIIDLRKDTPMETINRSVDEMRVGAVNGALTKLTFRFMLLRRAYTKRDLEGMTRQTNFRRASIKEDGISIEVELRKPLTTHQIICQPND